MPKLLVEFAKAGLTEPTLIRLDVETKIPETLKLGFFLTRMETKPALLLHTLTHVIPENQQVVIFVATRHHVEYLHALLDKAGIGKLQRLVNFLKMSRPKKNDQLQKLF